MRACWREFLDYGLEPFKEFPRELGVVVDPLGLRDVVAPVVVAPGVGLDVAARSLVFLGDVVDDPLLVEVGVSRDDLNVLLSCRDVGFDADGIEPVTDVGGNFLLVGEVAVSRGQLVFSILFISNVRG